MTKLLDSGAREEFESGAVREITDGKGRFDLLPLSNVADVIAHYYRGADSLQNIQEHREAKAVLKHMDAFIRTKEIRCLYVVLKHFANFKDTIIYDIVFDAAYQYEDGAKKYSDRNWEKGMPTHRYVDSAMRHFIKLLRGDTDEPHDRAFVWNIFSLLWTLENKPELDDINIPEEEDD